MATNIRLKSSSVSGKTPSLSDLSLRELAVNTVDGKLFLRKGDGSGTDKIIDVTAPLQASEPMGHEDKTQSTISFNNSTRVFTIQPSSTGFNVWCKGVKYRFTTAQTLTIPNTTGLYYIYFDGDGVLQYRTTFFDWENDTPTAYVYWNATAGTAPLVADERHGIVLDWQTHEYLHRTRGAVIANGFSLSNYTTTGTGANNTDAQFDLGDGTFFDEDLEVNITHSNTPVANTWQQDLQGPARIPVFYLSGTGWVRDNPTDYAVKQGTARIQYNALNAGSWSATDVSSNTWYTTSWIIGSNNINYPVLAIMGQSASNKISDQESISFSDLTLTNFPVVEFRPLWKIIWQTDATYANTPKARIVGVYDIRQLSSVGIGGVAVSDHGLLTGLTDDDHLQYLHTTITRTGVTAEFNTTGKITTTNNVGIGTTNPTTKLEINGVIGFTGIVDEFGEFRNNIRIGDSSTGPSLTPGSPSFFSGYDNVFIGRDAGNATTSGAVNIFIGRRAGRLNTSGSRNTFIGQSAGQKNTTGERNIFLGQGVGIENTTGVANNFIGADAGQANTIGSENNFFGLGAGYSNTTGDHNNFIGVYSAENNTTGIENNFIGYFSGINNISGSKNTYIGNYTGISQSASNKIIIGLGYDYSYPFDCPNTTKSTQFAVGIRTDANPSKYWLVGDENFNVGIGTTSARGKLDVTSPAAAYNSDSLVIGGGTLTYPTTQYSGWGGIVVKGTTSDARMFFQDGQGRINSYWNAYLDVGGYKYIVSNEPAVREQMHVAGTTGGYWSVFGAPAGTAGSALTWTQTAYIESGTSGVSGSVWFSPRGTSSDFYINNIGSIGIGTSNPVDKLHVSGTIRSSSTYTCLFGGDSGKGIELSVGNTSDVSYIDFHTADNVSGFADFSARIVREAGENNFLSFINLGTAGTRFLNGTTELVRITNTGNIGVGTTNPQGNLHLVGTVDPAGMFFDAYGIVAPNIIGRRANGTISTPTAVVSADNLLVLNGRGHDGTSLTTSRVAIFMKASENWNATSNGTRMEFVTTPNGSTSQAVQMYIDGSGNVLIGNAVTATGTTTQKLQVFSGAYFSGNVGIANTNPTEILDVIGNIKLTGELRGPASFVIDPAAVGDNTGTVIIKGDLQVDGTTTTLNSTTLTIDDKNIVIADGVSTLANLDTAGIDFGSTAVRLRYNHNGGTNSGLSIEGTNVGIGTTVPTSTLHVQGSARITGSIISTNYFTTTSTGTVTGGAALPISNISASSYRSVEYIIQAVSTTNYQVTKLLLVHDGTNAYITEYGSMTTNAQVASYVADISGGNIIVTATPTSVNTTNFKVYATAIAV